MKPSIPKGTRDFLPDQVEKRQFIFSEIRKVFSIYGYVPIETPVIEKLETLTGKYGEEGDKLLFKILNNGDYLAKADKEAIKRMDSSGLAPSISSRGLRYDLTVPFARFVAMHQNEINFPFKRYQIQQVWRADRPQRGRYREFYQCDADVIGSESLMYEAELLKVYDRVFSNLGIKVTIKYNHRKLLMAIIGNMGLSDRFEEVIRVIDKIDKIGRDGVVEELEKMAWPGDKAIELLDVLSMDDIEKIEAIIGGSEVGGKAISELKQLKGFMDLMEFDNTIKLDLSLARGLDYYTGCIFEVVADDAEMGSLGGGGRYDDLTGIFDLSGMSGVGISFGAERIYDVMEELSLFPSNVRKPLEVFFMALDEDSHRYAFECVAELRKAGIPADLYPDTSKLKKQMKYANAIGVPYTIIVGSNEQSSGLLTIKEMKTGGQNKMTLKEIKDKILQ